MSRLTIFFLNLLLILPYFLSEALLILTSFTLYMLLPDRRRKAVTRIRTQNLPENVLARSIFQFGRNLSFMLKGRLDAEVVDKEKLGILKSGGIAVSYHFGPWEALPKVLSRMGFQMGVVTNYYNTPVVDQFLYKFRTPYNIEIFYVDGPESEIFRMIKFIKSGGIVGALIDGETYNQKFEGLERLSRKFKLPIIPIGGYLKNGKLRVKVDTDLNKLVRYSPENYFWFYSSRTS